MLALLDHTPCRPRRRANWFEEALLPPLSVPPDWPGSEVTAHRQGGRATGSPEMFPLCTVTVMAPPLLKIGPEIDVTMA